MVVVRLLKSFDAQPRLAVVTKTIYSAWKELNWHLFSVWFPSLKCKDGDPLTKLVLVLGLHLPVQKNHSSIHNCETPEVTRNVKSSGRCSIISLRFRPGQDQYCSHGNSFAKAIERKGERGDRMKTDREANSPWHGM